MENITMKIILLILVCSGLTIVSSINAVSVDSTKTEDDVANLNKEKPIVILGASYAAGLEIENLAGYSVINKGVAGEQSFEMLSRFDKDVVSLNPEKVILWGFINDIFRADRSQINTRLPMIKDNYEQMVALAQKNGITPVLATEITMGFKHGFKETIMNFLGKIRGKASYQDYINGHVMEINTWIKDYAVKNNLMLLDIQSLLVDSDTLRKKEYSQEDGSHVSPEGYALIANYIVEQFSKRL